MHPERYGPLPPNEEPPLSREQAFQRIAETAEYVSQRALQLDEQVQEAEQIVLHLSALARQLRTLSSNTTLEATRMRMSGPLAEIARQMRRISQQISESNDQLGATLRSYTVATGELHHAAASLMGDTRSAQAEADDPGAIRLEFPPVRPPTTPPHSLTSDTLRRRWNQTGPLPEDSGG